jgi:hypothetical protein
VADGEDMASVVEAERQDEAWIQGSNAEQAIRVRNLTMLRGRGVTLLEVRLLEQLDETWTIWVRLSDRPGEFRLNLAKSDEPRTYRDVALALAAVREEFGFYGNITCSTERRPAPKT